MTYIDECGLARVYPADGRSLQDPNYGCVRRVGSWVWMDDLSSTFVVDDYGQLVRADLDAIAAHAPFPELL